MIHTLILRSFLSLLLSFFLFRFALPFSQNEYEIRDLESHFDLFTSEAQAWQLINNLGSVVVTECSDTRILGGYGLVGQDTNITRSYTDLGSHNVIQFSIQFWLIDFSQDLDLFEIYFDDQLVGRWNSSDANFDDFSSEDLCGGSNPDYAVTVKGSVPHITGDLTITIVSLATASSFSIGLRDVSLLFATTSSTPSLSVCEFVVFGSSTPSCLCPDGYYDRVGLLWCRQCNSACETCMDSGPDSCTACKSDYFFDGSKCSRCDPSCATCSGSSGSECTSCGPGKFLYWNGTCQSSCPGPLVVVPVAESLYAKCQLPCGTTDYYYQNGTCGTNCDDPFTEVISGDLKYCNFKCSQTEFLYGNDTCIGACEAPYTQIVEGFERYCQPPCEASNYFYQNQTCQSTCDYPFVQVYSGPDLTYCNFKCCGSDYLFRDDTCSDTCDYPHSLVIQGVEKYCKAPCDTGSFFYENDTCISGCSTPFIGSTIGDMDYCNFTCTGDDNFLYDNGTCTTNCSYPYTEVYEGVERYCKPPCESGEFFYENGTCSATCDSPFIEWYSGDNLTYCIFQCSENSGTGYLYDNGTCTDNCTYPYIKVAEGVERYCKPPCVDLADFFYQNGSCLTDCQSPFYTWSSGYDLTLCNFNCSGTDYLYGNGTCIAICDAPYIEVLQGVERYCRAPCDTAGDFYYQNGTCSATCEAPFVEWYGGNDLTYCNFQCADDEFLYNNGTCFSICDYPYTQIIQGVEKYCKPPCETLGDYFYQNETCMSTCSYPFEEWYSGDDLLYCNFKCNGSDYLYVNDTCLPVCEAPTRTAIIEGVERYCNPPCQAGDYLYQNGSCILGCVSPFTQNIVNDMSYCNFPCSNPAYFLYSNGSCMSNCPSPYTQVAKGVEKYCQKPCPGGKFYYENGTCLSSCLSPFKKFWAGPDLSYCNFKCSAGQFLYSNGTCMTTCPSPYTQVIKGTERYCQPPCPSGEFYYRNGTCESNCPAPFVQFYNGADLTYCDFPCKCQAFLDWEDKCRYYCEAPFIPVVQGVESYCLLPCGTDYFYQNSSCISTCVYPFHPFSFEGTKDCHFKCYNGEYLYDNGTCMATCNAPYIEVLQGVERYCKNPCSGSDFYYQNGTCLSNCPSPFTHGSCIGYPVCNFPCSSHDFWTWDNVCQGSCDAPFIQIIKGTYEKYCNSPCDLSDYVYQNATCQSVCAVNFYESDVRQVKYCNFTCPENTFLYWNQSCLETCDFPLIPIKPGVESYCQLPCETDEFYYENTTCSLECPPPYVPHDVNGFLTCDFPCSGSDYLNWNDTCISYCPTTFQRDVDGVMTCLFHCDANLYHYWNDSCLPSCDVPLKTSYDTFDPDYKYCDLPCLVDEYLYLNGSCASYCNYTVIYDPSNTVTNCTFPCATSEYLYQNDTCNTTCPSPYIQSATPEDVLLCNVPCVDGEYYRLESGQCVTHCNYPLTIRYSGLLTICENVPPGSGSSNGNSTIWTSLADKLEQLLESFSSFATAANAASSIFRPNNQNSVFMISLAKSAKHVNFIDLSIYNGESSRLLVETGDSSGFAISKIFTFKMPNSLKAKFEKQALPEELEGKLEHTSFLVNFWEALTSFMSLFMLAVFSIVCEFIAKKTKKMRLMSFIKRFRNITEWNFLLFALFNSYDDITFFTIIELKTLHLNSAAAVFSFLTCLAVFSTAMYILYKLFRITQDSLRIYRQTNIDAAEVARQEDDFYKKHSKYQSLFYGYQSSSFLKQGFLLIFIGRIMFCYILMGGLYYSPVAQSVLLTLCSIAMLAYLVKEKPTYDRFHLVIIILFEILGLIINLCMLILACQVAKGSINTGAEDSLAKGIAIVSVISDLLASLVLWGYVIICIYNAYKKWKEPGFDSKTMWLNVLVAPYQPPGMEFYDEEEAVVDDFEKGALTRKPRRRIRPSRRRTGIRVKPLMSALNTKKRQDQATTSLTSEEMLTSVRKAMLEKESALQIPTFIRMESDHIMTAFKTDVEFDFLPMSPLSPVSTEAMVSPTLSPSHSPQRSPKRLPLKSPDSQKTRKRSATKSKSSATTTFDKPFPVIIEEATPKGDTPSPKKVPPKKSFDALQAQVQAQQQGQGQPDQENNNKPEKPEVIVQRPSGESSPISPKRRASEHHIEVAVKEKTRPVKKRLTIEIPTAILVNKEPINKDNKPANNNKDQGTPAELVVMKESSRSLEKRTSSNSQKTDTPTSVPVKESARSLEKRKSSNTDTPTNVHLKESARSLEKRKSSNTDTPTSTHHRQNKLGTEQTAETVINLNQVKETQKPEKKIMATLTVENNGNKTERNRREEEENKYEKIVKTGSLRTLKKGTIEEEEETPDSPSVFIGYDLHVTNEDKKVRNSARHFARLNKKKLHGSRLKIIDQDDIPEITITDSFDDLDVRLDG